MWNRWNVDWGSDMIELDVDCLLFFPVEGTGSNPEWGIRVLLPAAVFVCTWRFLVTHLVRSC